MGYQPLLHMGLAIETMAPSRMVLASSDGPFLAWLDADGRNGPVCSCQAAVENGMTEPHVRELLVGKGFVALRSEDVIRLRTEPLLRPAPVPPGSNHQVLFVTPARLGSTAGLADHPHVHRLEMVARIVRRWFPEYRIGPALGQQEHSQDTRRRLSRGVIFLRDIGLIDPDLLRDHYPLAASVLIPAAALGFLNAPLQRVERLTADFFDNPAAFLATGLVGPSVAAEARRRKIVEIERALWEMADGAPVEGAAPVTEAFSFSPAGIEAVKQAIEDRAQHALRGRSQLASLLGAWPTDAVDKGGPPVSKPRNPKGLAGAPNSSGATLAREVAAFERLLPELLEKHAGEFALVQGGKLRGTFRTQGAALREGHAKFGYGPMLVREIVPAPVPARAGAMDL